MATFLFAWNPKKWVWKENELTLITWNELQKSPYSSVSWGIQASGVRLPESITNALAQLWDRRTSGNDIILPEEVPFTEHYPEGAKKRVSLNAYERRPQARAACIAHFGFRCSVCDLILEDRYGRIAAEFIHVHHIIPLSKVRPDYCVNPRKDLRPVCPNCHAVIHRREPPLSVAEARRLVRIVRSK